jgi:NAD(P)-dependent dehydrogenase (short-subunit alcohol dehydrogenase family)
VKYNNLFDLSGKVAVVTGGVGLLGKEFVMGLAGAGALTVIADANKVSAGRICEDFKKHGFDVIYQYLNITKEKSISRLIESIDNRYGHIDIWVNNAYPKTSDWGKKFQDIEPASWKKNIDMHLFGYFMCCKNIAEYMKKQKSGSIINLSSIYGFLGPDFYIYKDTAMTMPAAYSVIKGGIINFTRYLASYYGKYKIRINCISPGGVYCKQPRVFVKRYIQNTPLGRMAYKEDIVGAVIYLASDSARYVTGHNLVVDGGLSII